MMLSLSSVVDALSPPVLLPIVYYYPQVSAGKARRNVIDFADDDLAIFAAQGAPPLPEPTSSGTVASAGAQIWYARYGAGAPIVLLHGGLGHSGNWGHQVPALVAAGREVIVVDSRGHGRSTHDGQPYRYTQMAADLLAVLDELEIARAALVGWSDGAVVALTLAMQHPERVDRVLFFACNVDSSGTKPFETTPALDRCFGRHAQEYAAISATPEAFGAFVEAVSTMQQTQSEYTAANLAAVTVPVHVLHSELDEFIRREHAAYIAQTIPGATFEELAGVSHFAPLQRPALFNATVGRFI